MKASGLFDHWRLKITNQGYGLLALSDPFEPEQMRMRRGRSTLSADRAILRSYKYVLMIIA